MAIETTSSEPTRPSTESLAANYAPEKEIDDALDDLLEIKIWTCGGGLWDYTEKQQKMFDKLTPALEDPTTLKQTSIILSVQERVADFFDALQGAKGGPKPQDMIRGISAPCAWASPYEQGLWDNLCSSSTSTASNLKEPIPPIEMPKCKYAGFVARRKVWAIMPAPNTNLSTQIYPPLSLRFQKRAFFV